MKRFLLLFTTVVGLAISQTGPAGSVVFNPATTENILATAGTLVCTVVPVGSAPYSQVTMTCTVGGTTFLVATATPLVAGAQGETVAANANGNAVTAILTQSASGGTIAYNIVATPSGGTAGTKTGTF